MLSSPSPLRDVSNKVARGGVENDENNGGNTTPSMKKSMLKKNAAATSADVLDGPIVFHNAVYESPNGDALKQLNGENGKLRDLNKKLIGELRNARISTKDATDAAAATAGQRATDGEQLQRVSEENAALRTLNDQMIHHLRSARDDAAAANDEAHVVNSNRQDAAGP